MTHDWKEVTVAASGETWDKLNPVEGKFVKVETEIGPNKSNMYTLATDDGEVKIWGSTVLDDKLLGVPEGTYVRIVYEGKKPSKNGGQYHDYKVWLDLSGQSGYEKAKAAAQSLKSKEESEGYDEEMFPSEEIPFN